MPMSVRDTVIARAWFLGISLSVLSITFILLLRAETIRTWGEQKIYDWDSLTWQSNLFLSMEWVVARVPTRGYILHFFSVFFFFCCGEFNCLESDFADRSCLLLKTSIMNDKTQKDGFTNRSRLFPLEVLCISVSCGTEASTRVVLFCFNYSSQNRSDTRRETSPVTSGPASQSAGEPSDAE